jgi:hypothetical protein
MEQEWSFSSAVDILKIDTCTGLTSWRRIARMAQSLFAAHEDTRVNTMITTTDIPGNGNGFLLCAGQIARQAWHATIAFVVNTRVEIKQTLRHYQSRHMGQNNPSGKGQWK